MYQNFLVAKVWISYKIHILRAYCPNIHTVVLGNKGNKKQSWVVLQKVFYVIHWLNIPHLVIALDHGIAKEIMNHSQQHCEKKYSNA